MSTNVAIAVVDFDGSLRAFNCATNVSPRGTNLPWCTLFDGKDAIVYGYSPGFAEYCNLNHADVGLMLFDPRLLGLTYAYAAAQTLESVLPDRSSPGRLELVGAEELDGRPTWHVRYHYPPPYQHTLPEEYWVDEAFRVYRQECNGATTLSSYANERYPWLPSRVVSYYRVAPDAPKDEVDVEILSAEANVKFPKARWGPAGMMLKPGTTVLDREASRILGTWNGKRLVATGPQKAPGWSYILVLLMLSLPAIFAWRAKKTPDLKH
ncbi:hypothetical protein KGQ27_03995 [Patescibacteria group bacterium]|nr:hypothetical protein [Patescibacteria group bacterium]